jgi:hypothetical protein
VTGASQNQLGPRLGWSGKRGVHCEPDFLTCPDDRATRLDQDAPFLLSAR